MSVVNIQLHYMKQIENYLNQTFFTFDVSVCTRDLHQLFLMKVCGRERNVKGKNIWLCWDNFFLFYTATLLLLAASLGTSQLQWSRHQVAYWLMRWDLVRLLKSLHVYWLIDVWTWRQLSLDRLMRPTHPGYTRCVCVCCQFNYIHRYVIFMFDDCFVLVVITVIIDLPHDF